MDRYSILDQGSSFRAPETASPISEPADPKLAAAKIAPESVRFPGDDGGRSLSAMAQRDLNAALQLLAERAQYITGASGAAIALREGAEMICRASAGSSAPELGATLQVDSGLSGESVRTRRLLRCDDAENDPRVNRESCRLLNIASVVVMPLVRDDEVNGVFELLSDRAYAFEERDIMALERLSEMIQTAVTHAEAANRAESELSGPQATPLSFVQKPAMDQVLAEKLPVPENKTDLAAPESRIAESEEAEARVDDEPILLEMALRDSAVATSNQKIGTSESATSPQPVLHIPEVRKEDEIPAETIPFNERGNIRRCEACGFPVSQGRQLCLDCEAKGIASSTPEFLSKLSTPDQSWLRSHLYLVATLVVVAATVALLFWFRFRP